MQSCWNFVYVVTVRREITNRILKSNRVLHTNRILNERVNDKSMPDPPSICDTSRRMTTLHLHAKSTRVDVGIAKCPNIEIQNPTKFAKDHTFPCVPFRVRVKVRKLEHSTWVCFQRTTTHNLNTNRIFNTSWILNTDRRILNMSRILHTR